MNFPIIHTNFWDAVIPIPVIMIITQLLKDYLHVPSKYLPGVALVIGLLFQFLLVTDITFLQVFL